MRCGESIHRLRALLVGLPKFVQMFGRRIRRSGKHDLAKVEFGRADVDPASELVENWLHLSFDPDMQVVVTRRNIAQRDLTVGGGDGVQRSR